MSTIPSGLTAKQMRLRMLDKATLKKQGSLYMGGSTSVSYQGIADTVYEIEELEAGAQYYPLISQGEGNVLNYNILSTYGLADNAITKDKLGNGSVVLNNNGTKKSFNVVAEQHTSTPDDINFAFGGTSFSLNSTSHGLKWDDGTTSNTYNVVRIIDENDQIVATWCRKYSFVQNDPTCGFAEYRCERTVNNQYCPNITAGNLSNGDPIYYGDVIRITYSKLNYYNVTCYYNGVPVPSGYEITVTGPVNISFVGEPYEYSIYFASIDPSISGTVTRSFTYKEGAPLGPLQSLDKIYQGDIISLHGSSSDIDKEATCYNYQVTNVIPLDTDITVTPATLEFVQSQTVLTFTFDSTYKYYNLTLTVNTGVQSIQYKTSSVSTVRTITSTQIIRIRSGDNVELQFTPASGYIASLAFYKVTTSYGSSYKIARMRSNQSWTPIVYHQGQGVASVTASASDSGSRRTYTLNYTNTSALDRQKLLDTNVGVSINGVSINAGLSRTFRNTVQGMTPITDDYCYVHFYVGSNPYSADSIHYGVVGTYTHD